MTVRFIDQRTDHIVFPEPFEEAPSQNVMSNGGTNAPPAGALFVNPLLAPSTLSWDVRLPFNHHVEHWTQAQRAKLAESATLPPMTRLEIQSPQLPWRIRIRPGAPGLFVSVHDVLYTIQEVLDFQITWREWELFRDATKSLVLVAKDARIQSCHPGRRLDERFKHPRRIDSLGGSTRFAGLTPATRRARNSLDLEFRQG